MGFTGAPLHLVARNAFTTALRAQRMHIRCARWSGAMARIMHAMAVLSCPGPTGLSVASNYLSVLAELAAERGAKFAITYDRKPRRHLKSEAVPVSDVAPFLNPLTTCALQPCSACSITEDRKGDGRTPARSGG